MLNPSSLLFIFCLVISTFISLSSSTWFGAWVGLEMNLLSFIPLMINTQRVLSSESALKYFLIQALTSLMLMFGLILNFYLGYNFNFSYISGTYVILLALFIKLGGAPFHMWFPDVAGGVSWFVNFLMMGWQKLAPFVLVYYLIYWSSLVYILIILSTFVGAVGGLSFMSLRKLMAYSSINHLAWMVICCLMGLGYFIIYYIIYVCTGMFLMFFMNFSGYYYISQVYYYAKSNYGSLIFMLNWLSFGGLPPFLGFLSKWMVLDLMMNMNLIVLPTFMVIMSLLSLYYYTRVCYTIFNQSSSVNLLMTNSIKSSFLLNLLGSIPVLGLLLVPALVYVF